MVWQIELSDTARKALAKMDKPVALRVRAFLRDMLSAAEDPRSLGDAFKGSTLGEFWEYRVGDWRLIPKVEDEVLLIRVAKIDNRREVGPLIFADLKESASSA